MIRWDLFEQAFRSASKPVQAVTGTADIPCAKFPLKPFPLNIQLRGIGKAFQQETVESLRVIVPSRSQMTKERKAFSWL